MTRPEFIEPTPRSRRRILAILAALLVVAVATVAVGIPRYFAHMRSLELCAQIDWMRAAIGAMFAGAAVVGAWLLVVGVRTLRTGQWPMPGASVWRRTEVKRGPRAMRRAWSMIVSAAVVLAAGAGMWAWADGFYAEHQAEICGAGGVRTDRSPRSTAPAAPAPPAGSRETTSR